MARPATIDDAELLDRLSVVFQDVGFTGASLAKLSEATGLQRASLYHRFPDGKEQMAREVLNAAACWLEANALVPLRDEGPPRARVEAMAKQLGKFYAGGKQACLLNMLSSASIHEGPFTKQIAGIFKAFIDALADVALETGVDKEVARDRAERVVMMLQGSLVLSRGTGSTRPFRKCLVAIPDDLLASA